MLLNETSQLQYLICTAANRESLTDRSEIHESISTYNPATTHFGYKYAENQENSYVLGIYYM